VIIVVFAVAALEQSVVPVATPWQYCVVEVLHVSAGPFNPLRNVERYVASPAGSFAH
jgi:hypothetical protein